MIKLRSFFGLLFLLLLMTVSWLYFSYHSFLSRSVQLTNPIEFTVKKGSGAFNVARQLQDEKLIDNQYWLKFFLWLNQEQQKIKAGRYLLKPGFTAPDIFQLLVSGKQVEYKIALVEGLTFDQVYLFTQPRLLQRLPSLKGWLDDDHYLQFKNEDGST